MKLGCGRCGRPRRVSRSVAARGEAARATAWLDRERLDEASEADVVGGDRHRLVGEEGRPGCEEMGDRGGLSRVA